MQKLLIVLGQEGVGKSTLLKSLVKHLYHGAVIDAEDLLQVNPWKGCKIFEACTGIVARLPAWFL